jgi:hypothetical protein
LDRDEKPAKSDLDAMAAKLKRAFEEGPDFRDTLTYITRRLVQIEEATKQAATELHSVEQSLDEIKKTIRTISHTASFIAMVLTALAVLSLVKH